MLVQFLCIFLRLLCGRTEHRRDKLRHLRRYLCKSLHQLIQPWDDRFIDRLKRRQQVAFHLSERLCKRLVRKQSLAQTVSHCRKRFGNQVEEQRARNDRSQTHTERLHAARCFLHGLLTGTSEIGEFGFELVNRCAQFAAEKILQTSDRRFQASAQTRNNSFQLSHFGICLTYEVIHFRLGLFQPGLHVL